MKFYLGLKQEMSQVYQEDKVVPVTILKLAKCQVVQVKTKEKDGYSAVQVGFGEKKKVNKPLKGHLKGLPLFRYLKEFRISEDEEKKFKRGDVLALDSFAVGEKVDAQGISKGKGFQGVVKRHGFSGAPKSHGTKDQLRMPGSIGATGPAHVFKGMRMAGQTGNQQVTIKNLEIIEINEEENILKLKGAVPGARNSLIILKSRGGEMKVVTPETKEEKTPVEPEKEIENKEEAKEPKAKENQEEKKEEKPEEKKDN